MRVYTTEPIPIKSWADPLEDGALRQAQAAANLPMAISHIVLLPDAHQGYGVPVGSALFAERAVVPYAIGVDIGCGVILGQTDLSVKDLDVKTLCQQILRDVPVGNGPHGNLKEPASEDWALDRLGYSEVPYMIEPGWWDAARGQIGSLGGGNHFIEVQADEDDRVYVMLHSGSRSLGKRICDHFVKVALGFNDQWHSKLPNRELAFLPTGSEAFDNYWVAMEFALRWAEQNRLAMLEQVRLAIVRHASGPVNVIVDCHHNYAAWESHRGKNGIIHRKGAVRARATDEVLIPGSMGTASYWGRGLGNQDSFETCQHGAGRAMARGAARRAISLDDMKADLAAAGTTVYTGDLDAVRDEAPAAYKNVEDVMAASTDLVEVVKKLRPLGTVKG